MTEGIESSRPLEIEDDGSLSLLKRVKAIAMTKMENRKRGSLSGKKMD